MTTFEETGPDIRACGEADLDEVLAVINDGASAYKGVIPPDCWHEPYMPAAELRRELRAGVVFWGCWEEGELVGVMGLQRVREVTLIRHAYVRTARQRSGIGTRLLAALRGRAPGPLLVGTWGDAAWAVRFYERHGFRLAGAEQKERLLRAYWSIPERQIETSVVLAEGGVMPAGSA